MKTTRPSRTGVFTYCLLTACITTCLYCTCLRPRAEIFPRVHGWLSEPERKYTVENLHEHINGAAEIFIRNNFIRAFSMTYCKGDIAVTADIYILSTGADAVNVFSSVKNERSVIDTAIGDEAVVSPYQIIFRQNNCYVDIQTGSMDTGAGELIRILAEKISSNIGYMTNNSAAWN